MARIRQMENTEEVSRELAELSPLLASMPRKTPYYTPSGYFSELDKEMVTNRKPSNHRQDPSAEQTDQAVQTLPGSRRHCRRDQRGRHIRGREYSGSALDRQLAQISDQEIVDYLQYNTDEFDNENIFTNVSLDEELPSVLPEELTNEEIDKMLEENILQETPFN